MRFLIGSILLATLIPMAHARTVVCPRVDQIGQVFMSIGGSFYWQGQVGDTRFRSNIRRDRSEKIVSFDASASYISNNDTEVCAYKMSIFRVNRLTYRMVYLRGQYHPPPQLTPCRHCTSSGSEAQNSVGFMTGIPLRRPFSPALHRWTSPLAILHWCSIARHVFFFFARD